MGGNRGQTAATTGRSSEHDCPGSRKPEAFLSLQHAGGGASTASNRAGGRSAPLRSSAAFACMTFVTPPPARPSCPTRTCCWWANFPGIDGIARRQATHILPTGILSRRGRRWAALSPQPWEAAPMLPRRIPASVHALSNQLMTVFTTGRHAGSLPGNGLKRERNFVFDEPNVLDGGSCQDEVLGNLAGDDDTSDRGLAGEVFLDPAHVSENLTHDSVVGAGNSTPVNWLSSPS